ncbi:DUF4328 domain-containing protein [Streptomyces coeruleoprunus]|uniref:DUF4328 domain-containing protein n=1 Tax=Streptomyces coeruleoprunus TaxID=285563 RepID=A0ABV9X747_9ACTN
MLRSPVGLSYAVVALLALVVAVDLFAIYASLNMRDLMGDIVSGDFTADRLEEANRADRLSYFSTSLALMSLIAAGVVFIVWFHRTRTNAGIFHPELQRRGPGWAIGSWFIPIANLWIPRQIAGDIWDASEQDKRESRTVLNAWWAAWVISTVLNQMAARMYYRAEEPAALRTALTVDVISGVVDMAAAVLAMLFVRKLTALQHAKALRGPQETVVPA